jgi:hypothetical protein
MHAFDFKKMPVAAVQPALISDGIPLVKNRATQIFLPQAEALQS